MDLGLKDRVALITGGSIGIGLGVALELAKEGAHVSICARNKEKLDEAAKMIDKAGEGQVLAIVADMSTLEGCEHFVHTTANRFGGRIDILFNNVGTGSDEKVVDTPDEKWMAYWNLNTMSAIRCSRAAIPYMKKNGWGRIVNNSSIYAKQPGTYCPVYNVTKAALMMFSRTLAHEMMVDVKNILVNNVNPGLIRTPLWEYWADIWGKEQGITGDQYMENFAKANAEIGRFCNTDELAKVVVFLCSAANTYVSGASIDVTGGMLKTVF